MKGTIDERIEILGEHFRGLWVSSLVDDEGNKVEEGWAVTINYKGDYLETLYSKTPYDALDKAISIVEKLKEKFK